jgi:hypothetical protein
MSEWQPIETAPSDGSRVLAYHPRREGNDRIKIRGADGEWWRRLALESSHHSGPTHWMPIPQPPQSQRSIEEARRADTTTAETISASLTPKEATE